VHTFFIRATQSERNRALGGRAWISLASRVVPMRDSGVRTAPLQHSWSSDRNQRHLL